MLRSSPLELIYHVENPIRQPWHDVLVILSEELSLNDNALSSLDKWLTSIKSMTDDAESTDLLVEFFEKDFQHMSGGGVVLDTSKCFHRYPEIRCGAFTPCPSGLR